PSSCLSAARARPWRRERRAATPPAEPGHRVSERRFALRYRYHAKGRHDPGAPVARTYPHCPRPQRRVRARGPELSVADGYRRADYRGALVGPAILWPDQARVHLAPRGDQSMTRSATNGTRRKGTVHCGIYTRKSSEEGLEQEFNSLQAQ